MNRLGGFERADFPIAGLFGRKRNGHPITKKTVSGYVRRSFGIDKRVGAWVITHLPTGALVMSARTFSLARRIVDHLECADATVWPHENHKFAGWPGRGPLFRRMKSAARKTFDWLLETGNA